MSNKPTIHLCGRTPPSARPPIHPSPPPKPIPPSRPSAYPPRPR